MGKLADALNAPCVMKVAGQEVNVARVPVGRLFVVIQDGLRSLDPSLAGLPLQDKVQECIDGGRFPMSAIAPLVYEAIHAVNDDN